MGQTGRRANFATTRQLARGHLPTLVHLHDDGVNRQFEIIEELLTEFVGSIDLFDPAQGHSRRVDRGDEHRESVMFGHALAVRASSRP
jgi:hypothetical protein